MANDIVVDTYKLNQYAQRINGVNIRISKLDSRLDKLYYKVGLQGLFNLMQADALTCYSWRLLRCQCYLQQTAADFENAERLILWKEAATFTGSAIGGRGMAFGVASGAFLTAKAGIKAKAFWKLGLFAKEQSTWDKFVKEFQSEFGLSELLKGAGDIGAAYDLINDIKNTLKDGAKSGFGRQFLSKCKENVKKTYDFVKNSVQTFSRYKKIGNAVGTKTAMTWWAKKITGLKPLGRASSAKNPFTRFANNLTNKTSPFNAQFKNIIGDFKGANGVGQAVAAWGSVAVTGITSWFSNKEEQASSNGKMSDARVIAETVSETVIDTVLTYGTGIVVGAAVSTALGTVAAPGVVVVAASGLIMAGVNAGVKALTGKRTTEWISDAILDAGEAVGQAVGQAVGKAAKQVTNSIGSWFQKLSFT